MNVELVVLMWLVVSFPAASVIGIILRGVEAVPQSGGDAGRDSGWRHLKVVRTPSDAADTSPTAG